MERYTESLLDPVSTFIVDWLDQNAGGNHKVAIGISGGKDSSVMAGTCAKVLGPDNVYGIMLPNGIQSDISDSNAIIDFLGIHKIEINIGAAFHSISSQIDGFNYSAVACTNFPARLRLATIMAQAQSLGATMVNTCNRSENVVGYCTLFGDDGGSFSPFGRMTTEEVIQIGDELGLPKELVHKTPVDGLQALSDEDKLGFTYHEINELIRYGVHGEHFKEIVAKYRANRFKLKIVNLDTFHPGRRDFFDMIDYKDNKIKFAVHPLSLEELNSIETVGMVKAGFPVSGLSYDPTTIEHDYVPPTVQEHNEY